MVRPDSREALVPTISGQHADYIVQEMLDFKAGRRKDPVMSAMVMTLGGIEDILDIAAYYASLAQMSGNGSSTPPQQTG